MYNCQFVSRSTSTFNGIFRNYLPLSPSVGMLMQPISQCSSNGHFILFIIAVQLAETIYSSI